VEIGNGPARIKIYTMNRRDGYPEFTLSWKEAGRRKTRSFASMEEARMIAQQTSVRLTNGWTAGDEVTRRDIDLLRHCEQVAQEHGVGLAAAMDEWTHVEESCICPSSKLRLKSTKANHLHAFPANRATRGLNPPLLRLVSSSAVATPASRSRETIEGALVAGLFIARRLYCVWAWHPLPGAPLRFSLRFVTTRRIRLRADRRLPRVLFCLGCKPRERYDHRPPLVVDSNRFFDLIRKWAKT
jgi:RNase P subunit RPR2